MSKPYRVEFHYMTDCRVAEDMDIALLLESPIPWEPAVGDIVWLAEQELPGLGPFRGYEDIVGLQVTGKKFLQQFNLLELSVQPANNGMYDAPVGYAIFLVNMLLVGFRPNDSVDCKEILRFLQRQLTQGMWLDAANQILMQYCGDLPSVTN